MRFWLRIKNNILTTLLALVAFIGLVFLNKFLRIYVEDGIMWYVAAVLQVCLSIFVGHYFITKIFGSKDLKEANKDIVNSVVDILTAPSPMFARDRMATSFFRLMNKMDKNELRYYFEQREETVNILQDSGLGIEDRRAMLSCFRNCFNEILDIKGESKSIEESKVIDVEGHINNEFIDE